MALDFFTGFDYYTNSELAVNGWTTSGLGTGIQTSVVRTGARAFLLNSPTIAAHNGMSNAATRIIGCAFRPNVITNNGATYGACLAFRDSTTNQITLGIKNDGAIVVWRGMALGITSSTTGLLATSSNLLSLDTWYYVEMACTFHGSTGTVEVFVNGTKTGWIDVSGANTIQTANAYANSFALGAQSGMAYYIDDLYCLSGSGGTRTTRLGDVKATAKNADTGNGTNADSTPSTGSDRGAMVDETTPNGDTDYNTLTGVGDKDTYNFPALGVTGNIVGLQVKNYARKTDAGTLDAAAQAYISSTLYSGTTGAVGESYSYEWASHLWEQSPATSSDWTVSEVDGAEFGIKRIA